MIHFAVFAQQRSENVHYGQHIICLLKAVEVDWKEACGLASGYWSYNNMYWALTELKKFIFMFYRFFLKILYN